MPNRFIKESICNSDSLAHVSPEAERLFWRLVVQADDFGCYEARTNVIIGTCFTSMLGRITAEHVESWILELSSGKDPMIEVYESHGKPYLHFLRWDEHQQRRAKNPKYPLPPSLDITCKQMQSGESIREGAQANVPYSNPNPNPSSDPKSLSVSPPTPPWVDGDFDALNLHLQGFFSDEQLGILMDYWNAMHASDKRQEITWPIARAETISWAKKFRSDIIAEAMSQHLRRYPGKPRNYTEGIMQGLTEEGWTDGGGLDSDPTPGDARQDRGRAGVGRRTPPEDPYREFAIRDVPESGG